MKKGFSLIELLAVIVILAIISTIALPIIIQVIDNVKINSLKSSANSYFKSAQLYISKAKLDKVEIPPGIYPIMEDGNICIGIIEENKCNGEIIKIQVKGQKPNKGKIIIDEKNNIKIDNIEINGHNCYETQNGYSCKQLGNMNVETTNGLITIDESKSTPLINYRIYGKTKEIEGFKNIADPQQIENFVAGMQALGTSYKGNYTEIITDENNRRILKLYAASGYGHENYAKLKKIFFGIFKENTEYTISFDFYRKDTLSQNLRVVYTDNTSEGVACINYEQSDVIYSCMHTTQKGKTVSSIDLLYNGGYTNIYLDTLQIEEGRTATYYVPYGEYDYFSVGNLITDKSNENYGKYEIPIKVNGKNMLSFNNRTERPFGDGSNKTKRNFIKNSIYAKITSNNFFLDGLDISYQITNNNTMKIINNSSNAGYGIALNFKVTPNTTYTVNDNHSGGTANINVGFYDKDGYHLGNKNPAKTFTTPDNCEWIILVFAPNPTGQEITFSNIQLELGSKATEYEEYKEEKYIIILDEPLRCVDEVCDYIDYMRQKVVRNVEIDDNGVLKKLTKSYLKDIDLPEIKINNGVNNISIDTQLIPSKFNINYSK